MRLLCGCLTPDDLIELADFVILFIFLVGISPFCSVAGALQEFRGRFLACFFRVFHFRLSEHLAARQTG